MVLDLIRRARPLVAGVCALGLIALAGCGGGVKRVPVSGNATLDGTPLADAIISFTPDASKGNTVRASCSGAVQSGHYELQSIGVTASESGPGVALGWYKVTLVTDRPGQKKIQVHKRFTDATKTTLEVEVVENPPPGAYDFAFTK